MIGRERIKSGGNGAVTGTNVVQNEPDFENSVILQENSLVIESKNGENSKGSGPMNILSHIRQASHAEYARRAHKISARQQQRFEPTNGDLFPNLNDQEINNFKPLSLSKHAQDSGTSQSNKQVITDEYNNPSKTDLSESQTCQDEADDYTKLGIEKGGNQKRLKNNSARMNYQPLQENMQPSLSN